MATKRAAIYCRISNDREGRELGVQRQEEDCRALIERLGLEVARVYVDNDISASTRSSKPRPDYQQMFADAKTGDFDVIVSYTSGRLTRRPREFEDQIDLAVEHGIQYKYVRSPEFDLNTAQGRRIARTMAAQDIGEAEEVAERIERAKAQTAAAGGYRGGRRPFGYAEDGMTLVHTEAAEIKAAADALLAGGTLNGIARGLNQRGVTTSTGNEWTGSSVARLLRRPRNAALIDHGGEIIGAAQWPPVLDEATWRAVMAILQDPSRRKPGPSERWLLSGIARCGKCGATVEAGRTGSRKRPTSQPRPVYQCSVRREMARDARELDDFITALVIDRLSRADALELLQTPGDDVDIKALHAEAFELRRQKDEATDMWVAKTIDTRQYGRATAALDAELEAIEARLAEVSRRSVFDGVVGTNVEESWSALALDRRRSIISELLLITLQPARRGRRPGWRVGENYFDPDSVSVQWIR
ncbi:recombinase family protein [Cryptosporangium phraense]|uniref:Recombinase family protein n=1 Tax=Cryptosporangium phraense TaxID=2593070 RepID=A0A545ASP2_9ACTN|nr:recombinase family protein [Cryptosporangium phraense]TQS44362.1 hypothetical protein FL583_15630 [Cryptosporangium phraense]